MDGFAVLIVAGLAYFLPSLIAWNRHVPSAGSVFVINLFFGWTLIGWVVALAMSCRTVPTAHLEELRVRRAARRQRVEAAKTLHLGGRELKDYSGANARPTWWH